MLLNKKKDIKPITNKCIVLDLDQTLVSTQENVESFKELGIMTDPKLFNLRNRCYYLSMDDYDQPGIGTVYKYWGITRPYTKEFLEFCFSYFQVVAVWSAGKTRYVEGIVDYLFQDLPKPHVVFTYDHIEKGDFVVKPLTKIISYSNFTKEYMNKNNILALDDTVTTFAKNKNNGVLIPAYEPKCNIKDLSSLEDDALVKFMGWLLKEEVILSEDVQKLNKKNIFTDIY